MDKITQMPARIWACTLKDGMDHWVDKCPVWGGSIEYIRADIAHTQLETMEEALRKLDNWLVCGASGIADAEDMAQSFGDMQRLTERQLAQYQQFKEMNK